MMLHGSPTSKRTVVYSNMAECSLLDLGTLTNREKELRTKGKLTSAQSGLLRYMFCLCFGLGIYKNRKGETRFHGTKELKGSQFLVITCVEELAPSIYQHRGRIRPGSAKTFGWPSNDILKGSHAGT